MLYVGNPSAMNSKFRTQAAYPVCPPAHALMMEYGCFPLWVWLLYSGIDCLSATLAQFHVSGGAKMKAEEQLDTSF